MDILESIPSSVYDILTDSQSILAIRTLSSYAKYGTLELSEDDTVNVVVLMAVNRYESTAVQQPIGKRKRGGQPGNSNARKNESKTNNDIRLKRIKTNQPSNEQSDNDLQKRIKTNSKTNQNESNLFVSEPRAHVIKNQNNNSLNNNTIPKEQKKEKESDDSSQKENPESTLIPFDSEEQRKAVRIDTAMVKRLWNDTVVSLRPVRDIKDQRLVHLQARIREEGWTTEELPVKLKELFQKVQDSEFLSGRNGKWTRCKFDWVVESRPWNNILEGMYDNENNQSSAATARTMFCQQGNRPRITERILNDGDDRKSDGGEPGARIELRQFEFEEDGRTIPYHPRPHQVIRIKTSSSH